MSGLDDLIRRRRQRRASLQRELEALESGRLRSHEKRDSSGIRDTTAADIERVKRYIAEIDAFLAKHQDGGSTV